MVDTDQQQIDMLIVGAGFAGLYQLYRARKEGLVARIVEAASDVGGTWWWNRYPGARCDVESMQYSYSWDEQLQQEWNWSERFATQPEILSYIRHVAERFDLRSGITFNRRVTGAEYLADAHGWATRLDDGSTIHSRFLVLATGCLSTSRLPEIPGRDDFAGRVLQTADWPEEGVDLAGQRVVVIGTGSSAIQAIPELAKQAGQLHVLQRTPNFSVPARNQKLSEQYVRGWKADYPALRKRAREETGSGTLYDFPTSSALAVDEAEREAEYRWRWEKGGANFMHAFNDLVINEGSNRTAAAFVHERIREIVKDPEVAELLCPKDYPIFTKRICVDSGYYATFNRPNVELVDLRAAPITRILPQGVQVGDRVIEADAIVYATGFDAITGAIAALDLKGRGGRSVPEKWAEGPRAYLGLTMEGFPNLITITGPGSPSVLSNVVVSIEQHVDWSTRLIARMRASGETEFEAELQAENDWVTHVRAVADQTLLPRAASWYMGANIPGKPRVFMPYIGVAQYRRTCEEIAADNYRGFRFASLPH